MTVRVWLDDANPIYRRGLACCLREGGFVLAGESSGFEPEPDFDRVDVLVFDIGGAKALGRIDPAGPPDERLSGQCTVLDRAALTLDVFLDSLCLLTGIHRTGDVGEADVELLRLLADGETPRRIARTLGVTQGAVRQLVGDLLRRMECRNVAQAVARALREGLI